MDTPAPSFSSAAGIPVRAIDLTLFFPFALRHKAEGMAVPHPDDTPDAGNPDDRGTKRLDRWVRSILRACRPPCDGTQVAVWKELSSPYPDRGDTNVATQYAEWVYFHPFIRSFLYTSKQDQIDALRNPARTAGKSVRILARKDMAGATLTADVGGGPPVELRVRNVHLYLFDTGVGMLSVELDRDGGDEFKLDRYLRLADQVRRVYAPYYEPGDFRNGLPGHCPARLTLTRPNGCPGHPPTTDADYGSRAASATPSERAADAHIRAVSQDCEPYTVAVWRELLWPLLPFRVATEAEQKDDSCCKLRYEQVLDDRMPLLAFVAVPDPRVISPGDWVRLTFVDGSGDSNRWPYSPAFYGPAGLTLYAYDRFWADSPAPPAAGWMNTRWLCCNYALTTVGSSEDADFFMDAAGGARAHVRYHYFKMALVAHFHRASLLVFKRQLADAVEQLQQGDGRVEAALDTFAERLQRVQLDLLAFRNMYWFTEVSNQLQGLELFDLLSKHLRTRELFQQVFEEAEKAAAIVSGDRDRRMNQRSARLAVLSAMFLLVAPAVTALFTTEEIKPEFRVGGALLASLTGVLIGLAGTKPLTDGIDWIARKTWRKGAAAATAATALVCAGVLYSCGNKPKDDPKPIGPNLILFHLPGEKPPAKP